MENRRLQLWLLALFIAAGSTLALCTLLLKHKGVHEIFENEENEEGNETGADKQLAMWFQARAYPDPYYLNDKYERAWKQAEAIRKNQYSNQATRIQGTSWTSIGPSVTIGGRILSIAIDPKNSNNIFIGSASGGIWKSTDAGSTWAHVETGLPVLGVASIVYQPGSSKVILAGTGEV